MINGRPSKYQEIITEENKNKVLEIYSKGGSDLEVIDYLGISKTTFYDWLKEADKQDFSDTIEKGKIKSQIWWENQGKEGIWDKNFNSTTWIFTMKNRFRENWSDTTKTEITGKDGGAIKTENTVLDNRIKEYIREGSLIKSNQEDLKKIETPVIN